MQYHFFLDSGIIRKRYGLPSSRDVPNNILHYNIIKRLIRNVIYLRRKRRASARESFFKFDDSSLLVYRIQYDKTSPARRV